MPDMLNRYSISSDILIVTDAVDPGKPFLRRNTETAEIPKKETGKGALRFLLPFLSVLFFISYLCPPQRPIKIPSDTAHILHRLR